MTSEIFTVKECGPNKCCTAWQKWGLHTQSSQNVFIVSFNHLPMQHPNDCVSTLCRAALRVHTEQVGLLALATVGVPAIG